MNILQKLSEIRELPTLPEIMLKVQTMVNSDEGDAYGLAKIIEQDPSLAAKILKVANSSYYRASSQKISSLSLAIARIGYNEVKNIVTAISLIKKFSKKSELLDYKYFWKHSLETAYFTKKLAEKSQKIYEPLDNQQFFLSGLLHDIGILVYDQFFHSEFEEVLSFALKNELSFIAAEEKILEKASHEFVGAVLLELWKLDMGIISGVRYHHIGIDKAPGNYKTIAGATYLAEYAINSFSVGSFEGNITSFNEETFEIFGIKKDEVPELYLSVHEEVESSEIFSVIGAEIGSSELRKI
jgi:HD-like signal output (HDOD) protein